MLPDARVTQVHWLIAERPIALVRFADRAAVVMKWPRRGAEVVSENEARLLGILAARNLAGPVRRAIPRLLGRDPASGALALEAVEGCEQLGAVVARAPELEPMVLATFAAVLAGVHTASVEDFRPFDPELCRWLPMARMATVTPAAIAQGLGLDFPTYVAALQAVDAELEQLLTGWRHERLVHCDLSPQNVLVGTAGAGRVSLVDWELAGFGDPQYDVGQVVGCLLGLWLRRPDATADRRGGGWTVARRNVALFLTAYRRLTGLDDNGTLGVLRYAGLVQFGGALGRLERFGSLGRFGHLSLLLGQRLLQRPDRLAHDFGLS